MKESKDDIIFNALSEAKQFIKNVRHYLYDEIHRIFIKKKLAEMIYKQLQDTKKIECSAWIAYETKWSVTSGKDKVTLTEY